MEGGSTEAWRRAFVQDALDPAVCIDAGGRVTEWNAAAHALLGYPAGEAQGRALAELLDLPPRERRPEQMREQVVVRHRSGAPVHCELTWVPLPLPAHEAPLTLVYLRPDVAHERERQLQLIMDLTPAFIAFMDREGHYLFVNRHYERTFGLTAAEIRGRPVQDVLGEEAWAKARPHVDRALAGEVVRYQAQLTDQDGQRLDVDVQYAPHVGPQGTVQGVVVLGHDVSDRRFLEGLARRLASTRAVEALVLEATRGLAERLGARRCWFAEIDHESARATVHEDFAKGLESLTGDYDLQSFGPQMVDSWRGGGMITVSDVTTDPRTAGHAASHLGIGIRAFITAPILRHGRLIGALNVATQAPRTWTERECDLVRSVAELLWPVMENLRLITALKLERWRVQSVLEQMPAGVQLVAPDGRVLMRNARMDEISGGFLPGQSLAQYDAFEGYRPDGTRYGPSDWPLARALLSGQVVRDEEVRLVRLCGGEATVSLSAAPVRSESGHLVAGVLVAMDISGRKELELRLQEAIRARDEFLSLASHELRTPITSMKLQFQAAARQFEDGASHAFEPSRVRRRVQLANRQLVRMTRLIEEMLDVSRIAMKRLHLSLEPLELGEVVREVVDRFEADAAAQRMHFRVNVEGAAAVRADRFRLEQVLENLFTNALRYGLDEPVEIRVEAEEGRVRLLVSDRGIGVRPEDLERIFLRFERATSRNAGGLGLGLYISQQIALAHGGRLWAEPREGGGSRFVLELPGA